MSGVDQRVRVLVSFFFSFLRAFSFFVAPFTRASVLELKSCFYVFWFFLLSTASARAPLAYTVSLTAGRLPQGRAKVKSGTALLATHVDLAYAAVDVVTSGFLFHRYRGALKTVFTCIRAHSAGKCRAIVFRVAPEAYTHTHTRGRGMESDLLNLGERTTSSGSRDAPRSPANSLASEAARRSGKPAAFCRAAVASRQFIPFSIAHRKF